MMQITKIMIITADSAIAQEMGNYLSYIYQDTVSSVVDSGEKALEAIKSSSDGGKEKERGATMPDLILLDIELNGERLCSTNLDSSNGVNCIMDASETAKMIRTNHHIPIVFIVRDTAEEALSQVKLDFPFGYVLTPISTRELKVTIEIAIYTARIEAERLNAQNELKKSDERYKALVENMLSGVAIYEVVGDGDDFIFIDLNKSAENIEGQKREELIGKSIFEARPGVREFGLIDTFKNVLRTGKPHHHPVTLYKDSRVSRYYDNYVYILSSGELVVLFKDETLKKSSEDEMKRLEAQLNQIQKMEAIGTMAGGIAHDFNNILFPILGCAEMLIEDSPTGSSQREFLNEILKAGQRAKELVKQILTFSRQEHHEVMPLSIQPIVKEIIKLSRAMLPSTITIEQDIPKECCMVMADPAQMHQVMMNLITNAFHAMEDTGGTLAIRISETENPPSDFIDRLQAKNRRENDFDSVDSSRLPSGKYLCIEVSDTGIGMDESARKRIFEPYFTTKEMGKGTGLGLSVVHGIVKGCKGNIAITSEPGKGTSFKVYIPGIKQKTFHSAEPSMLQKYTGNETILVVDDEPVVVKMLGIILKRAGYKPVVHTDSLEALNAFREQPDIYRLVITDLTMPGITGDKLCSALKEINPNIPVILCTGFSTKASDLETGDSSIDRVIMKPIISHDLLKTVRELLESRQ